MSRKTWMVLALLNVVALSGCATWSEHTDRFVLHGRVVDSVSGGPLGEARVSLLEDVPQTTYDSNGKHIDVLENRPVYQTLTDACGDFELICDLRYLQRHQPMTNSDACVVQDFRLLVEKDGYFNQIGRFTGFPCAPMVLKLGNMELIEGEKAEK